MNPRAITWLLAALMALCAGQAVPAGRAQSFYQNCPIVWIARQRTEKRVVIEKPGTRERRPVIVVAHDDPQFTQWLLPSSLYQRPPPRSFR